MRSAIVIPLALSLALHASLAWLAIRVTLPRRDMPISRDLTIGLTVLPTTLAAPEPLTAAEESAASAGPAEVASDAAPASGPTAPAQEAKAEVAAGTQTESPPAGNAISEILPETAVAAPPAAQPPAPPSANAAMPEPVTAANSETPPSLDARRDTPATAEVALPPAAALDAAAEVPAADLALNSASSSDALAVRADGRIATAPTGPVPEMPGVEPAPAVAAATAAPQSTPTLSTLEPAALAPLPQESAVTPEASNTAVLPADMRIAAVPAASAPGAPGAELPNAISLPEVALQSAPASASVEPAAAPQQAPAPTIASQAPVSASVEAPEASAETVASAEVADPEAAATIRRATAFVDGYDGGPCVYVAAERIEPDVADVDSFATTADAFGRFHEAFAAVAGFEPAVTGQKIWKPQCPAVDLLRKLHAAHAVAPALHLDTVDAKDGLLHGDIRDPLHRPLHLYWISEAGAVRDLSAKLAVSNEGARFTLNLARRGAPEPLPQMLLVLAGDPARPSAASWDNATTAFNALLPAHGASPPPGAAAKLFLLRD